MKGDLLWRASVYDITINTNKSTVNESSELIEKITNRLETYIKTVLNKNAVKLLIQPIGGKSYKVKNISSNSAIEANMDGKALLHSHTIIRIEHEGKIKLNIAAVKTTCYKYMEEVLTIDGDFKKPYVNIKAISDTAFNMENYISSHHRDAQFIKQF